MRNLKKILALVLALVMSLSLMATAGASQFPDVDESNPYATAIDVLDELKVFQGYKEDGTFRPTETLSRAQAAVLVYRIATGDVEDKYIDNYTYMAQSKFNDLEGYNWARGYINYCQNAGIVVGTSATTFDPGAKVTGYQLLVMLLRTLGYGKAGEFSDPKGWELQTATIAEREGITKNVTGGDFGAPAPRQMVAEILFRGLLTDTVEYSALVPGGYTKSGETLGKREFGLEQVSGVVMANQWANLEGSKVLAADTTVMKVDDKNVTINKATDLDAVGLTYNAYIANGEGSTKRALTLEEGANTVAFNEGAGTTVKKLADDNSLNVSDAEYYLNYAEKWSDTATSTWRISYAIDQSLCTSTNGWSTYISDIAAGDVDGHTVASRQALNKPVADGGVNTDYWYVAIRPGKTITATDLDIMNYIFDVADRQGENVDSTGNAVRYYGIGEVYAGTSSTQDQSDIKSWPQFDEEFLDGQNTNEYDNVVNGNSLRIVDNNNDGKAEYVLRVDYTQDKTIGERRDVLQFNKLVISKYKDNNLAMMDEIVVGDVINYTVIDDKLTVYKADMVTDTIHNKNFKNTTVDTTDEGETHGQSEIDVYTNMETNIMLMAEKTSYNIYFDEFGYIRSYELAQGTEYALLTEMYTTGTQNWNYINTTDWTAEVKIADADLEEMSVANTRGNAFISDYAWTSRSHNYYNGNLNFLQPAIAHLGNPSSENSDWYWAGETVGTAAAYSLARNNWNRGVFQMRQTAPAGDQPAYGVFNYGAVGVNYANGVDAGKPVESSFSFTNVAAYTSDGEDISLAPATRLSKDTNGAQIYRVGADAATAASDSNRLPVGKAETEDELVRLYDEGHGGTGGQAWFDAQVAVTNGTGIYPVYAVDYVQLTAENVKAGMRHFTINNNYNTYYNTTSNTYVNANNETVFYVVTPSGVSYYDSYEELPTIKASDIRAAYAVATNTNANADGMDYWVGDVIVIETKAVDKSWDSISLAYANPYETSGSTQYFNTLNSEWRTYQPDSEDMAKIGLVPNDYGWTNATNLSSRAFYEVYGTDYENGELAAAIVEITQDWNDHGIHAGTIRRTRSLTMGNGYIDVDTLGRDNLVYDDSFVVPIDVDYDYEVPFYRISNDGRYSWDADQIDFATDWTNPSGIKVGDQIIWVTDKDGDVAFVVDLGSRSASQMGNSNGYTAPTWLISSYNGITDPDTGWTSANVTGTGWYYEILKEQRANRPTSDNVQFNAYLLDDETITIQRNGKTIVETKNETGADGVVVTPAFSLLSNQETVDIKVRLTKADGTHDTIALATFNTNGGWWTAINLTGPDADGWYTVKLANRQIRSIEQGIGYGTIYSGDAWDGLVEDAAKAIGDGTNGTITLERAQEVKAALTEIKTALNDSNAPIKLAPSATDATEPATPAEVTEIVDAIGTADTAIDDAITAGTWSVTVSDTNRKITVSPDVVQKGATLSGVTLTLSAADGYTLPTEKPAVTVGGGAVDAAKVTWNSTTGALGFAADAGTATGAIAITANSVAPSPTDVNVTAVEIAAINTTVEVAQGGTTTLPTTATINAVTLASGTADKSEVSVSISWVKKSDSSPVTGAVGAGTYTGTITLTANTGYALTEATTLKIGTGTADVYDAESKPTVEVTVSESAGTPTDVNVTAVEIAAIDTTVEVAQGGTTTLPTTATINAVTLANGTADKSEVSVSISWVKKSDSSPVTGAVGAGTYTGTITLTANTGYALTEATTLKIGTGTADVYDAESKPTVEVTVSESAGTPTDVNVTAVEIAAINTTVEVAQGGTTTLPTTATIDAVTLASGTADKSEVSVSISWVKKSDSSPVTGAVGAGTYTGTITLTANTGYALTEATTLKIGTGTADVYDAESKPTVEVTVSESA